MEYKIHIFDEVNRVTGGEERVGRILTRDAALGWRVQQMTASPSAGEKSASDFNCTTTLCFLLVREGVRLPVAGLHETEGGAE